MFILGNVIPNPKKLYHKSQADKVDIMEKKISPNNLAENRSESRNISEEDIVPLVEKEVVEWHLDNVEPYYFFKGAVLSFIFCLPFIILFNLHLCKNRSD